MSIRVKLLRMLLKRPYGLARFRVGRTFYTKIIRFDKDNCEWIGGKYWFGKDQIVIERNAGNRKVYDLKEWASFEEGYPIVYFDANNAIPLTFHEVKLDGMPTPKAIQASLKKEMATYEAEVMRKTRSKLMLGIIICIIAIVALFGLQMITFQELGKIAPRVVEGVRGALVANTTVVG